MQSMWFSLLTYVLWSSLGMPLEAPEYHSAEQHKILRPKHWRVHLAKNLRKWPLGWVPHPNPPKKKKKKKKYQLYTYSDDTAALENIFQVSK